MIADQFVAVGGSDLISLLQEVAEPFVHVRPGLLRHTLVGRVPDQVMAEAELVLADVPRGFRPDEFLPDQSLQVRLDDVWLGVVHERRHVIDGEHPADDRRALDHGAFVRAEAVEARVALEDGIDVDQVESLLVRGARPCLIYVITEGHNPLGVSMSVEKRHRLVELARTYEAKPIIVSV